MLRDLRGHAALCLCLTLDLAACAAPHEYTIQVKDPRAVALAAAATPASPADGAPTLATGMHDGRAWTLVVFREEDGSLRLRCQACNRDAFLIASEGVMHVVNEASPETLGLVRPASAEVAHGALVTLPYSYCGFPTRHGCSDGAWSGSRVTPWSNVSEVRARRGTSETGSPLVLAAAVLAGLVGTSGLVIGLSDDPPAARVGGVLGGSGALTLSAWFMKLFIEGNSETVLDRGGR
jgi:hypothetical protein